MTVPWAEENQKGKCLLYSAQFSKGIDPIMNTPNRYIIGGGGGNMMNEAKIFDTATHRVIASVKGLNSAIYSVDLSADGSKFVLGGGGKGLMVFDWDANHTDLAVVL